MKNEPRNLPASIRARLLAVAKAREEDFNIVVRRYGIECVLRRLVRSPYADRFVLKGAMLFVAWTGRIRRPTRDLDLLGSEPADPDGLRTVFSDIIRIDVADGLDLTRASVTAESIIESGTYHGVRIRFEGVLDKAIVPVQVDVGFGDAVVPPPELITFPALLEPAGISIRGYPREAVIAEKLHAIVTLGENNSRMKDFHDIIELAETCPFDGTTMACAIRATFERRGIEVLGGSPAPAPFFADGIRSARWQAFYRKLLTPTVPQDFAEVGNRVQAFLEPIIRGMEQDNSFQGYWPAGGPWR